MDTVKRVRDLAEIRGLTLFRLSRQCGVPYCTLKNAEDRGTELSVYTIERICKGLDMSLVEFFDDTPLDEDVACFRI